MTPSLTRSPLPFRRDPQHPGPGDSGLHPEEGPPVGERERQRRRRRHLGRHRRPLRGFGGESAGDEEGMTAKGGFISRLLGSSGDSLRFI